MAAYCIAGASPLRGGKSNFGGAVLQDVTVVEVRKLFGDLA